VLAHIDALSRLSQEKIMLTKGKLTTAAALVFGVLGAASIAQAGSNNQSINRGGFDIGPLGQCFDPADCGHNRGDAGYGRYRYGHSRYGRYGYAYVPGWGYRRYR
jgi:hypothetical protein